MTDDPYNLGRFIQAQAPVYESVRAELKSGRKRTHWMWFVFPQAAGLGQSPMSRKYAIGSADEARAYLADPILGQRLRECTQLVLEIEGQTIHEIFGSPDDLKFRSCMTLFSSVAAGDDLFKAAIERCR